MADSQVARVAGFAMHCSNTLVAAMVVIVHIMMAVPVCHRGHLFVPLYPFNAALFLSVPSWFAEVAGTRHGEHVRQQQWTGQPGRTLREVFLGPPGLAGIIPG